MTNFQAPLSTEKFEQVRAVLETMIESYGLVPDMEYEPAYVIGHQEGYKEALKAAILIIRNSC